MKPLQPIAKITTVLKKPNARPLASRIVAFEILYYVFQEPPEFLPIYHHCLYLSL